MKRYNVFYLRGSKESTWTVGRLTVYAYNIVEAYYTAHRQLAEHAIPYREIIDICRVD